MLLNKDMPSYENTLEIRALKSDFQLHKEVGEMLVRQKGSKWSNHSSKTGKF